MYEEKQINTIFFTNSIESVSLNQDGGNGTFNNTNREHATEATITILRGIQWFYYEQS